jgi:hypothetical protein
VKQAWEEAGREGKPRLLCGCYYAVGPEAGDELAAYVNDYYPPFYGPSVEPLIESMRCVTPQAITDTVKRFEDIGCDEFVFQPVTPSIGQLHGLAELVL